MNMTKSDAIAIPRWAWALISSILLTMLAGGITWCSSVNSELKDLNKRPTVDHETVQKMIEKEGPYVRDKASLEARIMATEKIVDRLDLEGRRQSDAMARIEAKLDLIIPKIKQP